MAKILLLLTVIILISIGIRRWAKKFDPPETREDLEAQLRQLEELSIIAEQELSEFRGDPQSLEATAVQERVTDLLTQILELRHRLQLRY